MSKWVRYISTAVPLLGVLTSIHIANAALWPFLGGYIYGWASERRRDVLSAPLFAVIPIAAVAIYYAMVDLTRFLRLVDILPVAVVLWISSWVLSFTAGAAAGYLTYKKR
ncbi:MAG: hypothetical protein ACK4SY_00725 [Pyrobaculum sp.]